MGLPQLISALLALGLVYDNPLVPKDLTAFIIPDV